MSERLRLLRDLEYAERPSNLDKLKKWIKVLAWIMVILFLYFN